MSRVHTIPAAAEHGLLHAWACDFSAGLGIVAPMLALWQVKVGVGEVRGHAFMDAHTAVPATVLSADAVSGTRGTGLATDLILAFQPTPAAGPCQVAVRTGLLRPAVRPGDSMAVVPRSPACEAPLIPAQFGDPMLTFAWAGILMVGGLLSLRLWHRLAGPRDPRFDGPAWSLREPTR